MKKVMILFLVINASIFAQFGPKISPVDTDYNFGDIKEGEIVEHNFIVFNKGTDLLKIESVKASCGCTAAVTSKMELVPNDSTSIKVSFNSLHRMGQQKKYVYVVSNDTESPQLRLMFSANVVSNESGNKVPEIKLSKYNHNFGNVKEGEKFELLVDVTNRGTGDLEIQNIKSSCGCTAALMANKHLAPNDKSELKINFDTKNLSGQVARTVTLFSNDPKNPSRVITLIANIEKE